MTTQNNPNSFAERLKYKMDQQGLSIVDLTELTGISYEMIRRYTIGSAKPRDEKVVMLADALSTTAGYLDYGVETGSVPAQAAIDHSAPISDAIIRVGGSSSPSPRGSITSLRYVPVLTLAQAHLFHKTQKVTIADSFDPVMGAFYNDNVYWIMVEDDSMIPEFKRRDHVLIDSDLQAMPSDFVLACVDEDHLVLRRWRPRGFDETTGKPYEQLLSEHEDYPIIDSRYIPFEVCGVAIERKQRLK